jgi:hypothetical protein
MTMDSIFYQPGDIAPLSLPALLAASTVPDAPIPEIGQLDRISRLAALDPEDTVAGLLWLAMNFPAVCDAMLDKTEFDAVDDETPGRNPSRFAPSVARTSASSCATAPTGGTTAVTSPPVRSKYSTPDPVVAWRLPGIPA